MAGFFRLFTRTGSASSPGRSRLEDTYQKITDNQPLNEYKDVMLLEGHAAPVRRILKISQSCFITAGDDLTVIIWNAECGSQMHVLTEHTSPVTCLCLLKDDKNGTSELESRDSILFMSASASEIIRWEMSCIDERFDPANNCKRLTKHEGTVNCLVLLRHGMVCSGGKDLCLWDIASGKLLSKYDWSQLKDNSEIFSVLELEGRNFGIVAVSNHTQPAVFDIKKSTMTQSVTYQLEFCCRVLSYHHLSISVLAPVSSTLFATGAVDGTVVIWSMNSLNMVKRFECIEDEGYDFTVSSPPTTAACTQAGAVPVTHIMTLCERYMFVATGKGFKVFDIYSSEGGSQALSEIPTMPRPILVHSNAHNDTITSMQFLPEKNILMTSSADCSVRLWGSRTTGPISPSNRDLSPFFNRSASVVDLATAIETFLGIQESRLASRKRSQVRFTPTVPLLIGELCLHTDSVQDVLYMGPEMGVVTIGSDNNVLLWKESELEREKRDEEIQKHLKGEMFYDAN